MGLRANRFREKVREQPQVMANDLQRDALEGLDFLWATATATATAFATATAIANATATASTAEFYNRNPT